MRYVTDITANTEKSVDELRLSSAHYEQDKNKVLTCHFQLSEDINWAGFVESGAFYNTNGNGIQLNDETADLAECFISPRYLEYFSLQAPKGEEGMYLGFSHLHSFLSSIFGFGIAGVLLTKYCPDPVLFETREAWEAASVNAHYIWYYFAVIGLVAAIALFVFAKTTEFIDKKKKA